jgi:hypothetical protein
MVSTVLKNIEFTLFGIKHVKNNHADEGKNTVSSNNS